MDNFANKKKLPLSLIASLLFSVEFSLLSLLVLSESSAALLLLKYSANKLGEGSYHLKNHLIIKNKKSRHCLPTQCASLPSF